MFKETVAEPSKPKKTRKLKDKIRPRSGSDGGVENMSAEGEQDEARRKSKARKSIEVPQSQREGGAMDISVPQDVDNGKKKREREERVRVTDGGVKFEAEGGDQKIKKRKRGHQDEAVNASGIKEKSSQKEKKKHRKDSSLAEGGFANPKQGETIGASTPVLDDLDPAVIPLEAQKFLEAHSITIHTPPITPSIVPILSFTQLNIPTQLRTAFEGFKEPTPIQACAWPPALKGLDVIGIAETGSGKTLAFGIPALCHLIAQPKPLSKRDGATVSVLVLAPTRELAIQTHDTLSTLGTPFGIASVAVFGGVPKEPQIQMLRSVDKGRDGRTTRIIVGTPGRILDLLQEGVCNLSGVDYLVLDEADRMLDKGFENDIRNIISKTKPSDARQTMMFSATWPEAVRRLASTFQKNPVRVVVGSDDLTANSRVEQSVEVLDHSRQKDSRLLDLLRSLAHKKKTTGEDSRVLIFALYKKEASRVEDMLRRQGYTVSALHGDMPQHARIEALEGFKNGTNGLLVATDVAARGLDIPNVRAVINYTFPLTIEDYIHRIGRTGRGGKHGKSITFFTGDNHEKALAGELARVLREGGFDYEALKRFPLTIKKKEHSIYGAFYRDDIPVPKAPTKIVF